MLHEDAQLLVLHKPSPLPMHPSGRFGSPSLVWLAQHAWPDVALKPAHRLDANTTGVLVGGKTPEVARALGVQFRERRVQKSYLARVHGVPDRAAFTIEAPIDARPSHAGTRRVQSHGQAARTDVKLVRTFFDGTRYVESSRAPVAPTRSDCTCQTVGLPIVGDAVYADQIEAPAGFHQATGLLSVCTLFGSDCTIRSRRVDPDSRLLPDRPQSPAVLNEARPPVACPPTIRWATPPHGGAVDSSSSRTRR